MISDLVRPARTVRSLLDQAALAYGELPALLTESENGFSETSYTDLVLSVRKIALVFRREYGQKKIIALPGAMGKDWLPVFLAVLYSGNIAVPVDLSTGDEETAKKLRKVRPDVTLCENPEAPAIKKIRELIPDLSIRPMEELRKAGENEGEAAIPEKQNPEDTALLIFTSGTTGDNKIVELTHRNVCADALLAVTYLDSAHGLSARVLSALPVFHMYGITAPIFGSVYRGFTLCIGGGVWTLKKDLQKFKPEILLVVPMIIYNFGKKLMPSEGVPRTKEEMAEKVSLAKEFFGGNLKTVITGGAPLEEGYSTLFKSFGAFLMNGYGITECSPIVSCDTALNHKEGAIGKTGICPDLCQVKILDGEICVKGEIVSPGYWKEPGLNDMVYCDGWFKTGDLGEVDEDGFLYITGRKKNTLILPDGNNISLDELESAVLACPDIDSAIVIGTVSNQTAILEAVVYADPANGKSPEENKEIAEAWIDALNRKNARYKRIARVRMLCEPFERTSLGKIKKYKYADN